MSTATMEFADTTKKLGDQIMGLTLKEAKELSDYLKDVHGIEPAAGGAVMMAGPECQRVPGDERGPGEEHQRQHVQRALQREPGGQEQQHVLADRRTDAGAEQPREHQRVQRRTLQGFEEGKEQVEDHEAVLTPTSASATRPRHR